MSPFFLNNKFSKKTFFRFTPVFLMMLAIFLFSARPSDNIPLSLLERMIYKGGHVIGYAMLAWSYWRAFDFDEKRRWVAWMLAVLYAISDEFHQSLVPGRHPTAFDVLVYDNMGALLSLWMTTILIKQKQPASQSLVVENPKH